MMPSMNYPALVGRFIWSGQTVMLAGDTKDGKTKTGLAMLCGAIDGINSEVSKVTLLNFDPSGNPKETQSALLDDIDREELFVEVDFHDYSASTFPSISNLVRKHLLVPDDQVPPEILWVDTISSVTGIDLNSDMSARSTINDIGRGRYPMSEDEAFFYRAEGSISAQEADLYVNSRANLETVILLSAHVPKGIKQREDWDRSAVMDRPLGSKIWTASVDVVMALEKLPSGQRVIECEGRLKDQSGGVASPHLVTSHFESGFVKMAAQDLGCAIGCHLLDKGSRQTASEIAKALNLPKRAVYAGLRALEARGDIARVKKEKTNAWEIAA